MKIPGYPEAVSVSDNDLFVVETANGTKKVKAKTFIPEIPKEKVLEGTFSNGNLTLSLTEVN